MQPIKHIAVVAGEESGDIHAANFIKALKAASPNLKISGIGGRHMQEAGAELIFDLARFGVTGLLEVVRHFRTIKKVFRLMQAHLDNCRPDLLVLVDYPGFNLRLAKYAKTTLNIRTLYYISPQIWAWKAKRINTIRQYVDKMAVIFPFEKQIYQQADVPVSYVGHPFACHIAPAGNPPTIRKQLNLPVGKRLIAMLPGSRTHEIEHHMPVLVQTSEQLLKKYPNLHFVIPVAGTLNPQTISAFLSAEIKTSFTLVSGQALEAVAAADCAIVASGTASLECALLNKPMCIIYKASLLTYIAAVKVVKIKYLGLCNLLQNKMIVPELLQYDCNADELTKVVDGLLHDKDYAQQMTDRLAQLKQLLSTEQADCSISTLILDELEHC